MTVARKEITSVAGRQRGGFSECLSRILPSRLARRVLAAGDADRQRIERDLHDGVQQRLTGLRIRLAVAAEDFRERGDTDASAAFNEFGEEIEQAIEEVRPFARGVYPAVLSSHELGPALVSASRHAAKPVSVSAHGYAAAGLRSRARPISPASPLFAIDNATKHAGPAQVSVDLWDTTQALHFTIRHTGFGFDPSRTPAGAGLTNMRDRITTLGGSLAIDSTLSHGTRLHGSVPDPWLGAAAGRRPPGLCARPPLPADLGGLSA